MIAVMVPHVQGGSIPVSMALVLFVIAPVSVALITKAYQFRPALTRRLLCAVLLAAALATAFQQTVSAFMIQCYWFMVECWF